MAFIKVLFWWIRSIQSIHNDILTLQTAKGSLLTGQQQAWIDWVEEDKFTEYLKQRLVRPFRYLDDCMNEPLEDQLSCMKSYSLGKLPFLVVCCMF